MNGQFASSLRFGLATLAIAAAPQSVIAQEQETLAEVVVTGSRLVRSDLSAPSPTTVINQDASAALRRYDGGSGHQRAAAAVGGHQLQRELGRRLGCAHRESARPRRRAHAHAGEWQALHSREQRGQRRSRDDSDGAGGARRDHHRWRFGRVRLRRDRRRSELPAARRLRRPRSLDAVRRDIRERRAHRAIRRAVRQQLCRGPRQRHALCVAFRARSGVHAEPRLLPDSAQRGARAQRLGQYSRRTRQPERGADRLAERRRRTGRHSHRPRRLHDGGQLDPLRRQRPGAASLRSGDALQLRGGQLPAASAGAHAVLRPRALFAQRKNRRLCGSALRAGRERVPAGGRFARHRDGLELVLRSAQLCDQPGAHAGRARPVREQSADLRSRRRRQCAHLRRYCPARRRAGTAQLRLRAQHHRHHCRLARRFRGGRVHVAVGRLRPVSALAHRRDRARHDVAGPPVAGPELHDQRRRPGRVRHCRARLRAGESVRPRLDLARGSGVHLAGALVQRQVRAHGRGCIAGRRISQAAGGAHFRGRRRRVSLRRLHLPARRDRPGARVRLCIARHHCRRLRRQGGIRRSPRAAAQRHALRRRARPGRRDPLFGLFEFRLGRDLARRPRMGSGRVAALPQRL